jgi:hypothetical protein
MTSSQSYVIQTCQYIENVEKIIVETWRKPSLKKCVRTHENRPEGAVGSIRFSLYGVLYTEFGTPF